MNKIMIFCGLILISIIGCGPNPCPWYNPDCGDILPQESGETTSSGSTDSATTNSTTSSTVKTVTTSSTTVSNQ